MLSSSSLKNYEYIRIYYNLKMNNEKYNICFVLGNCFVSLQIYTQICKVDNGANSIN